MDKLDFKILEFLKENGRAKFVDIARFVGLSEGAVRRRIKNLIINGTITKFTVEIQSIAEAIILVQTNPAYTQKVAEQLVTIAQRVFEVSGNFDIAALITATDMESLNTKVDTIRQLQFVTNTNTLVKLVDVKRKE